MQRKTQQGAWVPETARLLRPGGRLHVLTHHYLVELVTSEDAGANDAVDERLVRSHFRPARTPWPEGDVGAANARGRHDDIPLGKLHVGAPLADRGGLEGPRAGIDGRN
jgi:hypothetical protein